MQSPVQPTSLPAPASALDHPRYSFLIALGVALLALTWQLGVRGLNEPDEGRYASVAFEMVRSGDWVVPHFQGMPHLTKPPLFYWLTALQLKAFGVNPWAARLVPTLAALGTLMLVWSLAFRWWGPRQALYATLLLLTAPLFFVIARLCDPNMLLTFWVTLGGWAALRWQDEGKSRHRALYYLAHGLAFLTKGPVGCILILLGQLAFRCFGSDGRPHRRLWWWPGFLLALTLGLSWYLLMIVNQPDRLDYFLRYELFDRVFTSVHKRSEPFWFFWAVLPAAFLPWLPVLATFRAPSWSALRARYPEGGLLFHVLLITLFFSLSKSKLPTYILPALPPLALLAAAQLRYDERHGRHFRWAKRLVALLAILLPAIMIGIGQAKAHPSHWLHGATVLSAVVLVFLLLRLKRCPPHRWLLPAAGLILIAYVTLLDVVRRHERAMFGESTEELMADWRRASPGQPGPFFYTHAPAGLLFYLHRSDPPQRLPLVKTNAVLASADYVEQLTRHLEDLRGQHAYVMASSYHLNRVTGSVARLPARALVQDRKYTILLTP